MENFSYGSYPDSGDSSPRSREIEFDNAPPWEDHLPQNYKAKFMCSYGGKIVPRPHDNQLCYVGGETKILAVDRSIKYPAMIAKLSALYGGNEVSFKYELPGEDLDALISVTNDDDLDHMLLEYDRLYRTTGKRTRMRLFLFRVAGNLRGTFGSDGSRPDLEQFVEALNSAPIIGPDHVIKPRAVANRTEFLFGLEKVVALPQPPPPLPQTFPAVVPVVSHAINPIDDVSRGYAGEFYAPKVAPEKLPATVPPQLTVPAGYWPEKQVSSGGFSAPVTSLPAAPEQPVYVIPASSGGAVFHPPTVQLVRAPTAPLYKPISQRSAPDVYREPPMYNVEPPQFPPSAMLLSATAPPAVTTVPQPNVPPLSSTPPNINIPPQVTKMAAAATTYPERVGVVRQIGGIGASTETAPFAPVAYDGAIGRQVYYTAPGGVVVVPTVPPPVPMFLQTFPPLAAAATVGSDGRPSGGL